MRLMADAAPLTDTSAPPPAPRARRSDAALQYITTATPFTILFCALIALVRPQLFAWFSGEYYTLGLGVMMLCTALTLQLSDFVAVLSTGKRAAAIMICAHVLLKPPTALALATLFRLDAASTSGLILLAATPAAQAASVAVLLARGNAALCVCVVTLLNLGAFALTPLLTRAFAGGLVVAIDGLAMSRTTLQVVVVPIVLGLAVNARLPCARVVACRYGPAVGSCIAALFAGSGTALISPILGSVPARLYAAVAAFHALSSGLAFVVGKGLRLSKADVRVLAILGACACLRGRGCVRVRLVRVRARARGAPAAAAPRPRHRGCPVPARRPPKPCARAPALLAGAPSVAVASRALPPSQAACRALRSRWCSRPGTWALAGSQPCRARSRSRACCSGACRSPPSSSGRTSAAPGTWPRAPPRPAAPRMLGCPMQGRSSARFCPPPPARPSAGSPERNDVGHR
jgi:BASS family bile acid:Na+ symporter